MQPKSPSTAFTNKPTVVILGCDKLHSEALISTSSMMQYNLYTVISVKPCSALIRQAVASIPAAQCFPTVPWDTFCVRCPSHWWWIYLCTMRSVPACLPTRVVLHAGPFPGLMCLRAFTCAGNGSVWENKSLRGTFRMRCATFSAHLEPSVGEGENQGWRVVRWQHFDAHLWWY